MASFASQFAAIGTRIVSHPGLPGVAIPAHHVPSALGAAMVVFIVVLVVLFAAVGRAAREVVSLYGQLMKVLAAVTTVVLSIVFVAGVSLALLIHR
jgi:hypothetical protein